MKNLLSGLALEKFWKFYMFAGEPDSSCRGTEAGCAKVLPENYGWLLWKIE